VRRSITTDDHTVRRWRRSERRGGCCGCVQVGPTHILLPMTNDDLSQ